MSRNQRRGRPTALTPEIAEVIIRAVRAAAPKHVAARMAGIRRETLWRWLEKGERGLEPYASFVESLERAQSEAVVRNIAHIQKAAATDWRAAAWYLERCAPEHFARTHRVQLSGDDESPVQVKARVQPEYSDDERTAAILAALIEAGVLPAEVGAVIDFGETGEEVPVPV